MVEDGTVSEAPGGEAGGEARAGGTPARPARPTCSLPGCTLPAFVENGRVHDYYGQTHATAAGVLAPLEEGVSDDEAGTSTPTAALHNLKSTSTAMTVHPLHRCRGCWQSPSFGTTWTTCTYRTKTALPW